MRMSREQTAETHARILDVAGRLFRERGFDGIGVADLMKSAGLTHGAFYNHFESKNALAGEASEQVLRKTASAWADMVDAGNGGFESFITTYLSEAHRDEPGNGCLIAALGADVARQEPAVRRSFTAALRPMIDFMARHVAGRTKAAQRERALVTLATLVGTVVLARAVDDTALSNQILQAARVALKRASTTES